MNGEILITKIKLSGKKPVIQFEQQLDNGRLARCEVDVSDSVPELREAMQSLLPEVVVLSCLDEDTWNEHGEVTGLSLKHEGDDSGFNLTAVAKIPQEDGRVVAVVANTPYTRFEYASRDAERGIEEIEVQAVRYIHERPQQLEMDNVVPLKRAG